MILRLLEKIFIKLPEIYDNLSFEEWDWFLGRFNQLQEKFSIEEEDKFYEIVSNELDELVTRNAYLNQLSIQANTSTRIRGAVPPIKQQPDRVPVHLLFERVNEIIQKAQKIDSAQKRKRKHERTQ